MDKREGEKERETGKGREGGGGLIASGLVEMRGTFLCGRRDEQAAVLGPSDISALNNRTISTHGTGNLVSFLNLCRKSKITAFFQAVILQQTQTAHRLEVASPGATGESCTFTAPPGLICLLWCARRGRGAGVLFGAN